jgi:hypothetical protein
MEVTIGGDKQEPRQRLVAVPFALRAGVADRVKEQGETLVLTEGREIHLDSFFKLTGFPSYAKKLISINVAFDDIGDKSYPAVVLRRVSRSEYHDHKIGLLAQNEIRIEAVWSANRIQEGKMDVEEGASITLIEATEDNKKWAAKIDFGAGLIFDPEFYYFFKCEDLPVGNNYSGGRAVGWFYEVLR